MAVGVALDEAEHALLGQHLFANKGRGGLALLGRYVRDLGVARACARAQGAETMRHLPDAVLVGDQNLAVAPGQAIRAVQPFDVAIDPVRLAIAVVIAKQRDVADFLLGHQYVAVRQHQEPPRMYQPGGEGGRGEAFRHARHLAGVGQRHRATRHDRAGSRWRQVLGLDGDTPADLLVGQRRRIVGRGGLGLRSAVLRQRWKCCCRGHNKRGARHEQLERPKFHRALPVRPVFGDPRRAVSG